MDNLSPVYYGQTMPGVERIAWLEIRKRFPRARFIEFLFTSEKNGIVVWQFDGQPDELLELRTTEDVFVLVVSAERLSRDWRDLRTVARLVEESPWLDVAARSRKGSKDSLTYRVVSRKKGKHRYRRIDFQEAVIKGIQRRYGHRWELVDENADLEIWANMLGSRLLCGVRLSDRTMRHRDYQTVHLPATLRPSVAAAMVLLTEPGPDDIFLDPMCGGGTLMAERMLAGHYKQVIGGDILPDRVQASRANLAALGKSFNLCRWDACRLPLAADSVDKVSTNLPFGKQVGSTADLRRLYPCFFAELARVLKPEGLATVLSSEYELVKDVVRRQPRVHILTGYSIAVLGEWGRIYAIRRVPS